MYVHSVKLVNFKSIGNYDEAEVILEERVTAIIGKNESGKSNVLDGLARVNLLKRNQNAFADELVNRNCPIGTQITYLVTLRPNASDSTMGINGETQVEISKTKAIVTGSLLTYYQDNLFSDVKSFVDYLESINNNPMQLRDQELSSYRKCISDMQESSILDLHQRMTSLDYLFARVNNFPAAKREEYSTMLNAVRDSWLKFTTILPTFFYRKADKHLKTLIKYEDIEKELRAPTSYPNSLLSDLLKAIGISNDDFLFAARSGSTPIQESTRRRINKAVREKINKPFSQFYQTEEVVLDLGFNAGNVSFIVQSNDGEALYLSERSNGLQWYLETFIDAQANNISNRNVVYLLDEPGTSLHVNAQRKLLELFEHLAAQGNQVVYTTHSPYMLNTELEGVHCIRAAVKNTDGYTYIYKSAYDAKIAPESQRDTLTPIIAALGMNLQDTFGPAKDKINIVTEGMSDYIYMNTMAKQLGIDMNKFAIIPSVGATNCVNICAILHGWGCKYIALFDFDKEGVESGGEHLRQKMFFDIEKQYCYVREVSPEEIVQKVYSTNQYEIEDVVQRSEIMRFCTETGTSTSLGKPLTAKLLCTAIENGLFKLDDQSVNNFNTLFSRIESYTG